MLVALVVVMNILAVSPELHERLHADAQEHGHACAVTLFTHGQLPAAVVVVAAIAAVWGLEQVRPIFHSSPGLASHLLLTARGPPANATAV